MTDQQQPMPAGWYPDPEQPGGQRYWTGSEWTGHKLAAGQRTKKKTPTALILIPVLACLGLTLVAVVIGALVGPSEDEDKATTMRTPIATEKPDPDPSSTTTTAPETTTTTEEPTTTTTIPPAQIQTEIDAEAQRVCAAAGTSGDTDIVDFDLRWEQIGATRSDVQAIADACAQEARMAAANAAGPIDVDAVVRNPDGVQGQFFTMVVEIVQFDAATGPCAFRGYWDNQEHEYSFDYAGDNAVFSAPEPCPTLDGIDNNDIIRLWVEGAGSLTYDTSIGGSTTVPSFEVVRAEVIRKA